MVTTRAVALRLPAGATTPILRVITREERRLNGRGFHLHVIVSLRADLGSPPARRSNTRRSPLFTERSMKSGIIFIAASPSRKPEPTRRGFDDIGSMFGVRIGTTPHVNLKSSTVSNKKQLMDGNLDLVDREIQMTIHKQAEQSGDRPSCWSDEPRCHSIQNRNLPIADPVGNWRKHGKCDNRRPPNYASSNRWRCGVITKSRVRRDLS